jgi:phosphate transport system protein
MSIHLQRDLEALEQNLLHQSSLVEQMVFRAVQSLREQRVELVQEVLASEELVNFREVEIEEECLKILALHQPVAVDLRRAATVLKINGDLERIADLAVNICERSHSLVLHPDFQMPSHLDQMADAAISMVREALDAFVRLDVEAAREVCGRDDVVDELNRKVIADVQAIIEANPADIEPAFHFYSASRHVERIADHATNIAEDVIYLVDGEIARHRDDSIPY